MLKLNNAVTTKVSNGKIKVTASIKPNAPRTIASHGSREFANYGVGGGGVGGSNSVSMSTIGGSQRNNMDLTLMGLLDDSQDSLLHKYYRDIYYYDSVAGSAVDLQSSLPFSDFDLVGVEQKQLETYNSAIARLNFKTTNRFISANYLVYGAFVGTNVYNKQHKVFTDMLPYDIEDCTFQYNPFASMPPMITVKPNKELQNFLTSDEPVIRDLRKQIPQTLLSAMSNGDFILDPLTTLFLVRKGMESSRPVSYYRRLLPIYLLEKTLLRGTLVEAGKRQRSLLHIQAGDDQWEATPEELQALVSLFQQADLDPLGPIIATRNGIQAAEARCLHGDTFINTNRGLLKIKDIPKVYGIDNAIYSGSKRKTFDVKSKNIKVIGIDGKAALVKEWHYQGEQGVYRLETTTGSYIDATENHNFVTLKPDLTFDLVKVSDVKKDTILLTNQNGKLNFTGDLKLPVNSLEIADTSRNLALRNTVVNAPRYMTTDLAFIIGCLVSDGSIEYKDVNGKPKVYRVLFRSQDKETVRRFEKAWLSTFGVHASSKRKTNDTKPYCYEVGIQSKEFCAYFEQLGLYINKDNIDGKHSYSRYVPDLIMRSNKMCQLAFLAAYLSGDGTAFVRKHGSLDVKFFSRSFATLNSLKIMLASLGFQSVIDKKGYRLTVRATDAGRFVDAMRIQGYLVNRKIIDKEINTHSSHNTGIPGKFITDFLASRVTRFSRKKDGSGGTYFLNDDNVEIFILGGWSEDFRHFRYQSSRFDADNYKNGMYEKHLNILKNVSEIMYSRLVMLLEANYKIEYMKSVEKIAENEPVFDLSIDESYAPIFVANNFLTKNSGGDFWKYTDIIDITNGLKLRALGISDTFLSGETSFATAEVALSVFIENLKAYRDYYTQVVFYDKLFPVIASVNGYLNKHSTQALQDVKSKDVGIAVKDSSSYAIPQVRWHKSLEPNNDRDTFEMLQNLTQLGFPVTLRMLAASAGLRVENIMNELDEDLDIRKKFSDYNKKVQETGGGDGDEGGYDEYEDFEGSSAMGAYSRLQLKNPYKRNFEGSNEIVGKTKTGKPKYIMNQKMANQKHNELIAKASMSMRDPNRRAAVDRARKMPQRKK